VRPVLVRELPTAADDTDGRAPFASFVRAQAEPTGLAALFAGYPVLARMLARACATAVATTAELLVRFVDDRDRLVTTLPGATRAPVVAVLPTGDRHDGGRATSVVEFADGARIVYRPRAIAAHLCLSRLVALVNRLVPGLGLATAGAVPATGYGWTEYVEAVPLATPEDAETYYRRIGGLVALLHLVRATDIHHENLIAAGDQPVLVDVETLFHPRLEPIAADPAVAVLADSVARTGLLPAATGRSGTTDISGVGGAPERPVVDVTRSAGAGTDRMRQVSEPRPIRGGANRPYWAGRPVEVADHATAVLSGFDDVYGAVLRYRDEFARLLRDCADVPVRVVVRPTYHYHALLGRVAEPELLRDARDGERELAAADAVPPWVPREIVDHELADLGAGDVPLFTTVAGARDLWAVGGDRMPGVLNRSGLDDALAGLDRFGEFDQRDQRWIVSAALASRRSALPPPDPTAAPTVTTAAGTDELLSAACSIADRLVSTTFGGDRLNWLGLEPVTPRGWLVLPMGAGLTHGYLGVALFLAQLSRISAVPRYLDVARHAIGHVGELLAELSTRPDLVAAVGAGGLSGFGGIAYTLARLTTLLDDQRVAEWARQAVALTGAAADDEPGWADGLAGAAVAMHSVATEIDCPQAGDLARRYAKQLAGRSGAAEAHAVAVVAGEPTTGTADPVWWCEDGADPATVDDLTLCHGALGRADVLGDRHQTAGLVLSMLRRNGPRCATPDRVPTPGLLTGLSGIGYGLLRLGFPDSIPSPLLLEPTPRTHP
jgi:type 2 lantibiotic biosynthesis protein LanM